MMLNRRAANCLLTLLLLISAPAQALLIGYDLDGTVNPNGVVTRDTDTGLEWLDLTETAGESYNSVAAGFGSFVTTHGFRFATQSEAGALFTNAGIVNGGTASTGSFAGSQLLLQMLGCLAQCSGSGDPNATGFLELDTPDPSLAAVGFYQSFLSLGLGRAAEGGPQLKSFSQFNFASFLVRSVPEPNTGTLLGIVLVGLAGMRRHGFLGGGGWPRETGTSL